MENFNKYGICAIKAINLNKEIDNPEKSWKRAAKNTLPTKSTQEKPCPKNAFLGLCEDGFVIGIEAGSYFKRVKPNVNKGYAVTAVKILRNIPALSSKELWNKVKKELNLGGKRHNSQMDVVLALWNNDLIGK